MTTPLKVWEEGIEEFSKNEWKHWHSKSSSFDRLPDAIKFAIKSHFLFLFLKEIEEEIGELEGMKIERLDDFYEIDKTRNFVENQKIDGFNSALSLIISKKKTEAEGLREIIK